MPTTKPQMATDSPYLSLEEAAAYLRIGVSKFNQLRRAGEIAGKRFGRHVQFTKNELDRYWDSLPADEPGISA